MQSHRGTSSELIVKVSESPLEMQCTNIRGMVSEKKGAMAKGPDVAALVVLRVGSFWFQLDPLRFPQRNAHVPHVRAPIQPRCGESINSLQQLSFFIYVYVTEQYIRAHQSYEGARTKVAMGGSVYAK